MNYELQLTKTAAEDAMAELRTSVDLGLREGDEATYVPSAQEAQRPNFEMAIYNTYGDKGAQYLKGLGFEQSELALCAVQLDGPQWINMRLAVGVLSSDSRLAYFPGVILPGGKIVYLATDPMQNITDRFSYLQHSELDDRYLTHVSNAAHGDTPTNVAELKHGTLLASSVSPQGIHNQVHELDTGNQFINNISATGIHNIVVNGKTRDIDPRVTDMTAVYSLFISPEHQERDDPPFTLTQDNEAIPASELVVVKTLAAARSREAHHDNGAVVNVGRNITQLVVERAS